MTDKTEISRFNYVLQHDGSWDWAVEVRVTRDDPLENSGVSSKTYGPMPPSLAESKFAVELADVITGLNTQAETDHATAVVDLAATKGELTTAQTDLASTQSQLATTQADLAAEKAAHAATQAELDAAKVAAPAPAP